MSQRPIMQKKLRRLRKALRTPLPVHFDLVDWLKTHRYAQTTGEANRLILAERVRSGSHVIGTEKIPKVDAAGKVETETIVQRIQPARYKAELIVLGSS